MSKFSGYKCNGCNKTAETDTFPSDWMSITINVVGNRPDDLHVCSNLCLERIGRLRKQAERELACV